MGVDLSGVGVGCGSPCAVGVGVGYAVRFAWDFNFFMCTKMVCLRLGRCH